VYNIISINANQAYVHSPLMGNSKDDPFGPMRVDDDNVFRMGRCGEQE
jgi:hypothetical protein